MTNLFIRTERLEAGSRQTVDLASIPRIELSEIDSIPYPTHIFIERIRPVAGSTKTKRVYSVIELDEIMLNIFGFKIKVTNGKEATVNFLTDPENMKIIERHNEKLREWNREQSRREVRDTPR
ncbi:Hypothetical protein POVR2_LOCUS25 [uncultured virus]|nr:Hypothetical protein POVR2_LOCUS25 [uncultured virus]